METQQFGPARVGDMARRTHLPPRLQVLGAWQLAVQAVLGKCHSAWVPVSRGSVGQKQGGNEGLAQWTLLS